MGSGGRWSNTQAVEVPGPSERPDAREQEREAPEWCPDRRPGLRVGGSVTH